VEGLSDRSVWKSHAKDVSDPKSVNFKSIMREIRKTLPKNIHVSSTQGSMFVRFDAENIRFLQVILIGLHNTPYNNGVFLFDIYLPTDYPVKPPKIKHITVGATKCTANNGPGGFSPNLHKSTGNVCLSLLGTWAGPGWEANKSNVYQILSSLLFMVFAAEHPYYMEPNHGGWEGNAPTVHTKLVIEYDEEVMFHTAKYAILETLKSPYKGFEDIIKLHFKLFKHKIVDDIQGWIDNDKVYSEAFRTKIAPVFEEIKEEFKKLKEKF
jgi:ubiquitin-protein ligase